MRNQKVYDLVILATFLTIIAVLTFTPLGYITFTPAVGATIVHIPVLVACLYFGMRIGWKTGLIFGLSSWIVALTRAVLPMDFVFRNPIVSVLPRVLFAIIAVLIFKLLLRVIKNYYACMVITAVLSTILHAAMVLSLLVIFGQHALTQIYGNVSMSTIMGFIKFVIVSNTIAESIIAGVVVPPIVYALHSLTHKFDNPDLLKIED